LNEILFNFEAPQAKPVDEDYPEIGPPAQDADNSEYLCGNAGPAFEGHNPGRDQDRSRLDEYQSAMPFARYVS
jgi:hypothetical protein